MRKLSMIFKMLPLAVLLSTGIAKAQDADFKPSGKLWGQVFVDEYYKNHTDSLGRGVGQYANGGAAPTAGNYPVSRNELQFRRIYLGYNYDFAPKFSAELLLSSEKDVLGGDVSGTGTTGTSAGNITPFIKYANLRWKGIFTGADLVIGQQATPAFSQSSEPVWGYRSVEKTIADFRGTQSYDMGIGLQGKFDPKTANFGYNVLLGNGTKASPQANGPSYKTVYGDIYGKFLDKKLIVDLYADYAVTARTVSTPSAPVFTQSRNMIKLVVGYTTTKFSVGVEGFINNLSNQLIATKTIGGGKDTLSPIATGISLFVRGAIIPKKLGFFARYDAFDPNNKINTTKYSSYTTGAGSGYNDARFSKESFITAGLDFTPDKNVHIMPNIWYNHFASQLANPVGSAKGDYDLVYRVTLAYTFGK